MAQLTVPKAPKEYSTQYRTLLGVDFRADQTEVDRRRSPDMVNMISDFGGNPVKRDGYRKVGSRYDALIMVDGTMYGILSTDLTFTVQTLELDGYLLKVDSTIINSSGSYGTINAVFEYQRVIYIKTEKALMSLDTVSGMWNGIGIGDGMMTTSANNKGVGEDQPATDESANSIPDVVISANPDGSGGTVLDDNNVLSIYQRVTYLGDGTSTAYKIPTCTKMGTWVLVETMDANGDWVTLEEGTDYSLGTSSAVDGVTLDGDMYATNNIVDATVNFDSPPSTPVIAGVPNVRIMYAPYSMEEVDLNKYRGYFNETRVRLLSSSACTFFNSRMFLADGFKAYYSDVSNPYMVSDLSWFDVDSEIVAFVRSNYSIAVLSKDNGKGTIYLATETERTVDSDTGLIESYFNVKESNAGVGAVAPKAIGTLSDEPLLLAKTGIYGIQTNYLSDKYVINRSSRINRKLCQEPNLETAVGIVFNDYFYLAVNGRMYVLDGRHKEPDRAGNKPFEAYYFEGLPAIENMFIIGDRMYFIDEDSTYTWNDDLGDSERYYDTTEVAECVSLKYGISNSPTTPPAPLDYSSTKPTPAEGEYLWYLGAYLYYKDGVQWFAFKETTDELHLGDYIAVMDAGTPVACKWCSVYDDDGAPQRLKTLMKKGSMVTLVPYFHSSCEITLVKDGDNFTYLVPLDASIQSFDLIDFRDFTFSSNQVAADNFTNKKVKKYKRLQIQIANSNAEPFGLTQITKTYTYGNYAKR